MEQGKILYTKKDDNYFIKCIGNITCNTISGFDIFIEELVQDHAIEDILIDLSLTSYIDSTNLGLIAEIARLTKAKGLKRPTILSNNEKINDVIDNMGLDRVFNIIYSGGKNPDDLKEVPGVAQDEYQKAKMVLKAHKNIMELSEKNKYLFKDVVELLEHQIRKKENHN